MNLNELISWNYELKCQKAVQALEKNGFTAVYCNTGQVAFDYNRLSELNGGNR